MVPSVHNPLLSFTKTQSIACVFEYCLIQLTTSNGFALETDIIIGTIPLREYIPSPGSDGVITTQPLATTIEGYNPTNLRKFYVY